MKKWPAHPATVENLNFPHKNISDWLKILTCGSHCPQKLWDRSLASAVRHRYGIKNVSSGFSGLITAAGRPRRTDGGGREGGAGRRAGLWCSGFRSLLPSPWAGRSCRSPGSACFAHWVTEPCLWDNAPTGLVPPGHIPHGPIPPAPAPGGDTLALGWL